MSTPSALNITKAITKNVAMVCIYWTVNGVTIGDSGSSFVVKKSVIREPMVDFNDCENVDECFSHFTAAMFHILSEAKFTLLRRACLENVNRVGGVTLPKDLINSIEAAMDLDNLFDVLRDSPYWNWMNIKMLTKMARASHLPVATKLIQQYKNEVYSRKLIEVLQQIPKLKVVDDYYTKIKEKWDKDLDDLKVQDLVNHWSEVEEIFDVKEPTLLLDNLINGCIEIHWLIPMELGHIFHTVNLKTFEMLMLHILHFDFGGHVITASFPPVPSFSAERSMLSSRTQRGT